MYIRNVPPIKSFCEIWILMTALYLSTCSSSRLGAVLLPKGCLECLQAFFGCHNKGQGCYWHPGGRSQGCCWTSYTTQAKPSHQKVIWPRVSLLRSRNLAPVVLSLGYASDSFGGFKNPDTQAAPDHLHQSLWGWSPVLFLSLPDGSNVQPGLL